MEGVFPEQGLWAGTTDVLEQLVLSEGLARTPWEAGSAPTPTTLCDSAPPAVTTRAVPHTAGHPLGGGGTKVPAFKQHYSKRKKSKSE